MNVIAGLREHVARLQRDFAFNLAVVEQRDEELAKTELLWRERCREKIELDAAKEQIIHLEQFVQNGSLSLAGKDCEIIHLGEVIIQLQAQLKAEQALLRTHNDKHVISLELLTKSMQATKNSNDILAESNRKLESANATLQESLDSLQSELESRSVLLAQLQHHIRDLSDEKGCLLDDLKTLSQRTTTLTDTLNQLKELDVNTVQSKKSIQQTHHKLIERIARLKHQRDTFQHRLNALQKLHATTEATLCKQKTEHMETMQRLQQHEQQIYDQQQQLTQLYAELTQLTNENKLLRRDSTMQKQLCEDSNSQLSHCQTNTAKLQARIKDVQQRNSDLQKQLQQMMHAHLTGQSLPLFTNKGGEEQPDNLSINYTEDLIKELDQTRSQNEDLSQIIREMRQEMESIEVNHITQKQTYITRLEEVHHEHEMSVQHYEARLTDLHTALEDKQTTINQLLSTQSKFVDNVQIPVTTQNTTLTSEPSNFKQLTEQNTELQISLQQSSSHVLNLISQRDKLLMTSNRLRAELRYFREFIDNKQKNLMCTNVAVQVDLLKSTTLRAINIGRSITSNQFERMALPTEGGKLKHSRLPQQIPLSSTTEPSKLSPQTLTKDTDRVQSMSSAEKIRRSGVSEPKVTEREKMLQAAQTVKREMRKKGVRNWNEKD